MDNEEFNKINIINKKEFDINKTNYKPLLINKKINLQNKNKSIFYLNIKNKIIDNNIKDIIQNLFKLLTICLLIIYYYMVLNKAKKNILRKLNSDYSEVIFTIYGKGMKRIISEQLQTPPDKIIVNNEEILPNTTFYNLQYDENIIKIGWNEKLTTCYAMLKELDISKVDFSYFDSSKVLSASYMFYGCKQLEEINFGAFDTSSLTDMSLMFVACGKLTSLNLSSFEISKVKNLYNMFGYCNNLEHIDLSNFNTVSVVNMSSMFFKCGRLKSINLSHFKTPSLENMNGLFEGCTSLISFDLSNFDTSKVKSLASLFCGCSSLKYINLNNFDTSKVFNMKWMFSGCKELTSIEISQLDLSNAILIGSMFSGCEKLEEINFNTSYTLSLLEDIDSLFSGCKSLKSLDLTFLDISKINYFDNFFYNCESIQYINISNFNISSVISMKNTFNGCKSLKILNIFSFTENSNLLLTDTFDGINDLIYCIKDSFKTEQIIDSLNQKNSINNCSYICFQNNSKYIVEKNICVQECNGDTDYKYEYKNRCYSSCNNYYSYDKKECIDEIPEGFYLNDSISKTIDKCPLKCKSCSNISMEDNLCASCNENYTIFREESKKPYIDCYLECPLGYINNNDTCEIDFCDDNTLYELVVDHSCIHYCSAFNFLNRICRGRNNSKIIKINIINNIRNDIIKGKLDSLFSKIKNYNKEDIVIFEEDITYQITSSYNQNNKKYENISKMIFTKCEKKLKSIYDIQPNETIIIFKIDVYEEGLLMPIVEYEMYHPNNYTRLDLSICDEFNINISVPVSVDEDNLYKYFPTSDYYNDKCFPFTSINGTDIILKDRQNEYISNNLTLCENNCNLIGYNNYLKYSSCECKIKNEINIIGDVVIDKDKLLENFVDIKNIINLEVMKCYRYLFTKEGILFNIGSYILLFSIFIYIISIIYFISKGYNSFIKRINDIIINNSNDKDKINSYFNIYIKGKNKSKNDKNMKIKKKQTKIKLKSKIKNKSLNKNEPPKKKRKRNVQSINISCNNIYNIYKLNDNSNSSINKSSNNMINRTSKSPKKQKKMTYFSPKKNKIFQKVNESLGYNDYEMNSLIYADALKYDHRTYFQYYLSLIRTKQKLIFTFFLNSDYNSKTIKICLFTFSFSLYYTINAFFITENDIHKIYKDSGEYDFIYNIPQILYSLVISLIINLIIKYFSLPEENIVEIKHNINTIGDKNTIIKLMKCLKIKFCCFFIASLIFLVIFWYYISCFCVVYKNTQLYLIKDTLISYVLSLLYPFGINLIPGLFRIPSLKDSNKKKESLYKFSKIIQQL